MRAPALSGGFHLSEAQQAAKVRRRRRALGRETRCSEELGLSRVTRPRMIVWVSPPAAGPTGAPCLLVLLRGLSSPLRHGLVRDASRSVGGRPRRHRNTKADRRVALSAGRGPDPERQAVAEAREIAAHGARSASRHLATKKNPAARRSGGVDRSSADRHRPFQCGAAAGVSPLRARRRSPKPASQRQTT